LKNKPHKCDICGSTFSYKHNLNSHVNVVHLKL